jgi:hypothetical protein
VHGKDMYSYRLLIALCGLFYIPQDLYYEINKLTYAYFSLCNFDGSGPLVLVLYEDVIIFVGTPKQLMMRCLNIWACEVELKDVEF